MSEKGLYMPNGTFVPFSAESLTTELATRQNAGAGLADVGFWLSQLPDPDPVLRKRGDDAAILSDLVADDQVTTAMLGRKNRVLNAPHYAYRAGAPDGESPSPEAQLVYEHLMRDLERSNLRNLVSAILDAPFYGMTPLELIWASDGGTGAADAPRRAQAAQKRAVGEAIQQGGWWHMADIVARPYHWFAYDMQNRPFFRGQQGFAIIGDPLPLPPGKFVIATHHATFDNPYGLRLLSRCLWPVAFKRGGMQFYAKFVERHGLPWAVGTAPARAQAHEKRAMAADLARMVQDCAAVIPQGAQVQLLTPTGGQDATHERFLSRQDKAISKVLMGQTLTVEMEGKNNSQAAATTHEDVAEGLADSDKAMVADAMNEIAWLYTQVNMGPHVFAPVFSYEEPEDLSARADLDKKLCDIGVVFTEEHFTENYNLKPSEFTLHQTTSDRSGGGMMFRSQAPKPALSLDGSLSFASADGNKEGLPVPLAFKAQENLDAAMDKLLPQAIKANEVFVTQLEKAVKSAKSVDDLNLALAELLAPKMTPSALESLLASSMTAAAGFGATAVQAEAKEDS